MNFVKASVVTAVLGMAGMAQAANVSAFLSTVGAVDAGVSASNPSLNYDTLGGTGSLYLWVTTDTKLVGAAFNLVSSNPGVIQLTGATVFNPDVLNTYPGYPIPSSDSSKNRWNGVGVVGGVTADTAIDASGQSVDQIGLDPAANGTVGFPALLDPMLDTTAGAFLFARFDYQVIGEGATNLYLQIGSTGIAPTGTTPANTLVTLGSNETQLLTSSAGNRGVSTSVADGTITVTTVPEPATLGLLAIGGLTLLRRRKGR